MGSTKTFLLLAAMTALFVFIGGMAGGKQGMIIAFVMAVGMNALAYWNSDKMVLSMHGAQQVDRTSAPGLVTIVERLAGRAGLPMPKVFIIQSDQPNAFATGRDADHAAVAATTGLLDRLSPQEVEGVMAHEMAHVKHRDILIMTITATFAGAIGMLASMAAFGGGGNRDEGRGPGLIVGLLMMVLAPMAATLVQMAISRTREYAADAEGARICGNPLWLASALGQLETLARTIPNPSAERHPATAHMFIVNPLSGRGMDNLYSTHPKMENRVNALREMAASAGMVWDARAQVPPPQDTHKRGPWG